MTRSICVFSAVMRSNLAVLKAIASFYGLGDAPVGFSSCRTYVAGSLCIMGMSLFSAVHGPDAIAKQHVRLAHLPIRTDVQLLGSPAVFHPPEDLGFPDRREPGGTR